jgi:hypothetical protein
MIQAAVISNGIQGIHRYFMSSDRVTYNILTVDGNFDPDLESYHLLIIPNGCDHIAMAKLKNKVRSFLDMGKSLFCMDGWFTEWVPGNQWIMDNSKKSIEVRYALKTDRYNLFDDVNLESFIFSHGISGWWSCGYIEAAPLADVIVEDTWNRPIIVLDEKTTNGLMFLTASGPLGDSAGQATDDEHSMSDLTKLYQNVLSLVIERAKTA